MRQSYFYVIVSSLCFFAFFADAATLIFKNQTDHDLYVQLKDWKRTYGLKYRQESPRKVGKKQELKWSPKLKSSIRQNILYVYDKNKKLIDTIMLKPIEGKLEAVPAGYHRTIGFEKVNFHQDETVFQGRSVSQVFKLGVDIIEKGREGFLSFIHAAFKPVRALIRKVKDPTNPKPYKIIHDNPYAKTVAKIRKGGPVACQAEKDVFFKRQIKVKRNQEDFLEMRFGYKEKPLVVAAVASGGGQRARLCSAGSALGAEQTGLLSCVTYISALSGGTWFLAPWMLSGLSLRDYKKRIINDAKYQLGFRVAEVPKEVKHAWDIFLTKFSFAHSINLVDLYGALLGAYYLRGYGEDGNPQRTYLDDLAKKKIVQEGYACIPVFAAVTAEVGVPHVWCWMTPWEFGSRWFAQNKGMYLPVWAFGRKFELSGLSKNWGSTKKPLYGVRPTLPFLMAIWGSAPAANLGQMWDQALKHAKIGPVKTIVREALEKRDKYSLGSQYADFKDLRTIRVVWGEVHNPMYKWSDSRFGKYKYLKLADAGVKFILPIFVTYRRPAEDNIKEGGAPDVLILWNSGGDISDNELRMQIDYAKKRGLPFPKITEKELKQVPEKVISVFTKNPDPKKYKDWEIPTVIYMPRIVDQKLVKKYLNSKDPELKELAKKLVKFDISACMKKVCSTFNFKYDKPMQGYLSSEQLTNMAEFNLRANIDIIKKAMLERVELNRKRDGIKDAPLTPLQKEKAELAKKVEVGTLQKIGNPKGVKKCGICWGDVSGKDKVFARLLCDHVFHKACFDEWKKKFKTCPVCGSFIDKKAKMQAEQKREARQKAETSKKDDYITRLRTKQTR